MFSSEAGRKRSRSDGQLDMDGVQVSSKLNRQKTSWDEEVSNVCVILWMILIMKDNEQYVK